MAQFESRFDVEKFENLTEHVEVMTRKGSEGGLRDAASDAADAMLEASAEIRRLQAMEDRLKSLMAYIRNQIDKDRKTAAEQGNSWLGVNSHTIAANLLDTDLQNLERVLNG